ncbi:non-homologous end joining protein Ku [Chelatococcus reniformis]|uniref:Non-homologous end joining protein Ku n=1 Tax=Chelatococcus reniformis TaxID=1494448 RepID=A0A916U704_9HYPH|nr:Ku protein [Chelatococcus reniformis]GGC61002.1 non-homologous end joining protein Ku [Chelatococcus reniformis]
MAIRPYWKGYLKLSLVTCPVAMMPAQSEAEKVRFHTLNRRTENRVRSQYIDAETGEPVADGGQVKGYQRGEHDYVQLEEEDLESVALESTRTIDVQTFVPAGAITPVWLDAPYYLAPDDPVGEEAFSVIRDAMADTERVGISRLVLGRRERAVMLEPRDLGIVLWTLRFGDEVRDAELYFGDVAKEAPDPKVVDLMGRLIDQRTKHWDRKMVTDPVQERLRELIAAKNRGRPRPTAKAAPAGTPAKVIDIMDVLRKSIAQEAKTPKRPSRPQRPR